MPQLPEIVYLLGEIPPTGQHDGHDCVVGFDHLCVACHGFSALATARRGERSATVLFDVGPYGDVWLANAERLSVDLSSIEVLFLSHWHWDHSGGIPAVVAAISEARRRAGRAPLVVDVHPDRPDQRGILTPLDVFAMLPPEPTIEAIEAAGGHVVTHGDAHVVADLFVSSGDIPRQTTYETGLAGHHSWRGDQVTLDPEIHDERLLLANVAGRGTTVLTACSHAGVVNVGLEARRLQPSQPIDVLLGGFHLAGTTVEDRIEPTVRDLDRARRAADRRARPLHRMASRRGARRRVHPDRLRAQRGRHALRAHCGIGRAGRRSSVASGAQQHGVVSSLLRRGWRVTSTLQTVEDEVEAEVELVAVVVAGLEHVLDGQLGEVRVLVGRGTGEDRLGQLGRSPRRPRTAGSPPAGRSRRCSCRGPRRRARPSRPRSRRARRQPSTASWWRRVAGPGAGPRLHQPDRPPVAGQDLAGRDRPAGASPPSSRRRRRACRSRRRRRRSCRRGGRPCWRRGCTATSPRRPSASPSLRMLSDSIPCSSARATAARSTRSRVSGARGRRRASGWPCGLLSTALTNLRRKCTVTYNVSQRPSEHTMTTSHRPPDDRHRERPHDRCGDRAGRATAPTRRRAPSSPRSPPPTLGDDEVLVRVAAASVDRGTWHCMTGQPYAMRLAGFGVRPPEGARTRAEPRRDRRGGRPRT